MAELYPGIMLAGKNPTYEPIEAAALRAQTLRSAVMQNQQAAAVNPQIVAANAQKIALNDQAKQEGALRLLTAQQDQEDGKDLRDRLRAASQPQAAQAQVAGPQSQITPGMVGVTGGTPTAPKTYDDIKNEFQAGGAQPRSVFAFQNMILGTKEKAAALQKTLSDTSKTQQEVDDKTRDFEASLANGVKDSGYNPSAMEGALHAAEGNPTSAPHAAAIRQALAGGASIQSIIDPMVNQATATTKNAFTDQSKAATAAAKQKAEQGGQLAESTAKQTALAGQILGPATSPAEWAAGLAKLDPEVAKDYPVRFSPQAADLARRRGMSAEQQTQADQATANATETAKRDKNTASYQQGELGVSRGRLGLAQKTFDATIGSGLDANGKPLSVEDHKALAMRDPLAVAQAGYQVPPPNRTSAIGKAQYDKLLAINPNYDGTMFSQRNQTAKDFSASGKTGQILTTTDTGLSHLATLSKAGDALKNGDYKLLNQMANSLGAQVGQSPQNTYDTILSMVAPEISKAVIGGVGGEADRANIQSRFSSSLAPQVREAAIGAATTLLGARYEKQRQAYESTMGKPLDRQLSPESQQVMQKYTGGSAAGQVTVTDPKGGVHQFTNQAAANAFKAAAGIK